MVEGFYPNVHFHTYVGGHREPFVPATLTAHDIRRVAIKTPTGALLVDRNKLLNDLDGDEKEAMRKLLDRIPKLEEVASEFFGGRKVLIVPFIGDNEKWHDYVIFPVAIVIFTKKKFSKIASGIAPSSPGDTYVALGEFGKLPDEPTPSLALRKATNGLTRYLNYPIFHAYGDKAEALIHRIDENGYIVASDGAIDRVRSIDIGEKETNYNVCYTSPAIEIKEFTINKEYPVLVGDRIAEYFLSLVDVVEDMDIELPKPEVYAGARASVPKTAIPELLGRETKLVIQKLRLYDVVYPTILFFKRGNVKAVAVPRRETMNSEGVTVEVAYVSQNKKMIARRNYKVL